MKTRLVVVVMLASTVERPAGVQELRLDRDVPYVDGGSADQRLDLSTPTTTGFPTVIFIHGGSLQELGERRTSSVYAGVCAPLVATGIGCATVDYRLAPTYKWPAMPEDVAAAVKWVKSNISARGGDPQRLFLFGHSSGCQLAAVLGTNPKYLTAVGLDTTDIAGIVAMGCVLSPSEEVLAAHSVDELRERWPKNSFADTYGSVEDWLDSDPSRFLGPAGPPVLVICAEAERFFPSILEEGAKFVRRLLEMKRPANLVMVPGRHLTSIAQFGTPGDPTFAAVQAFVADPVAVAPKHGGHFPE
jgi:acetyl esterase/lipase